MLGELTPIIVQVFSTTNPGALGILVITAVSHLSGILRLPGSLGEASPVLRVDAWGTTSCQITAPTGLLAYQAVL